ncbi:MAG: filamentous hemagglutinin N-terminal domain-containing protein [Nostoc sp.]|uniref:two-partner secretion domain-containing protein n=1 Tax=Nostoc sp. TaxID=1180 RepID=UPI002FF654A9
MNITSMFAANCIVLAGAYAFFANCAIAQITPDSTLPNNSTLKLKGNTIIIEGGTQAGSNLFHSFEQFSVLADSQAYFNNASDIQNIISRVTGSSVSNIDGLIRANGRANLFLINPSGIIFGPNASLNIGGSFLASTASAVKFADSFEFSATSLQTTPLLTVSVPIGLQYGRNPASILNESKANDSSGETVGLQVQSGKTLALVGGNLILDGGNLKAQGGRVEIAGVAGPGVVGLNVDGNNLRLSFPNSIPLADVLLNNEARLELSSNDIQLLGRRIVLTNGSEIVANTLESKLGGTLTVTASDSVQLIGRSVGGSPSSLLTATQNTQAAGDLRINTGKLIVQDGAQISTGVYGAGQGGNLIVNASESVELSGISADGRFPSVLFTGTIDNGDGGDLSINTGKLIVQDGAQISTGVNGAGRGGNLNVNASESVELNGTNANHLPSGLFSSSLGTGNAGNLSIQTEKLSVRNGAEINVSSLGAGSAGNLQVAARSIRLDNQGKLLANSVAANGGNITLVVQDLLLLQRPSEISAVSGTAQAGGNGGNLTLHIPNGFIVATLNENSDIIPNAFTGWGDVINIVAKGIFGSGVRYSLSVELPRNLVDAPQQIDTSCNPGSKQKASSFIITGRGGLPRNPYDLLSPNAVLVDWVTLDPNIDNRKIPSVTTKPTTATLKPIVEATGWVINAKGEMELTANAPTTPHGSWQNPVSCRAF